jgi:hypothetical protein
VSREVESLENFESAVSSLETDPPEVVVDGRPWRSAGEGGGGTSVLVKRWIGTPS